MVRRVARAHGFLDPLVVLARLQRFAQPSEVAEPIELLRAGAVFHARGLLNSRVLQHNRDWVWPHWVERQFDPADPAFIPRAFSITHVNLTHRNWTAVGLPDLTHLPIVDPCGLVTPLHDGWSLDFWVLSDGAELLPSRAPLVRQRLEMEDDLAVSTRAEGSGMALETRVTMVADPRGGICRIEAAAQAPGPGWLVVALRPANPEGVSLVHQVALADDRRSWSVDGAGTVLFAQPVDRHTAATYREGDVHVHLLSGEERGAVACEVGMATAAALFALSPDGRRDIAADVPMPAEPGPPGGGWGRALAGHCALEMPDQRLCFLWRAALRSLVLHAPHEVWPGPYTYKRFWFRDAAFIIHALACTGLLARAERALDLFPQRQRPTGYFHSQDGEWDSNGQALWIMRRFCELAGSPPKTAWWGPIRRAARWIARKRLPPGESGHAGLLPAGFSAEHLGPNDYYYWDDFWAVAGLRAAAAMAGQLGHATEARAFADEACDLSGAIDRSLARTAGRLGRPAMPASPHRRLDAGAIGSLAAGYPLQLVPPDDPRLLDTVAFLRERCFFAGGFFQEMTHSGINPYLTLHVAQVLMRAGDPGFHALLDVVAALASPTGQWPEAVHPRTLGGCMGDGQHVWAAAEWVLMLRNAFLREEGDALLLAQGLAADWLRPGDTLSFGPAPTRFGPVLLRVDAGHDAVVLSWTARWHGAPPRIEIRLPGAAPVVARPDAARVVVGRGLVP